jgi:phospholipid/cholesterol/gamma-HCH transport system substrate-binding protein
MQKNRNDVWVGLFVLVGTLALLFMALKAANLLQVNFQPTYEVKARFDNIGGLKVNAAVKSAGVVVGRVQRVALDPQRFQAEVVLAMDSAYTFPKDSSLKILTSGLLGEQYVGIQAGYDEAVLKAGDVVSETQSAVVLENLISQFLFNQAAKPGADSEPK